MRGQLYNRGDAREGAQARKGAMEDTMRVVIGQFSDLLLRFPRQGCPRSLPRCDRNDTKFEESFLGEASMGVVEARRTPKEVGFDGFIRTWSSTTMIDGTPWGHRAHRRHRLYHGLGSFRQRSGHVGTR
jgi:hypothetical protein